MSVSWNAKNLKLQIQLSFGWKGVGRGPWGAEKHFFVSDYAERCWKNKSRENKAAQSGVWLKLLFEGKK